MLDYTPLILAVDDDPGMLEIVEHYVRGWGYAFRGASDPEGMWEAIEAAPPNVILMDMQLDVRDGVDLVPELRRRLPDTPLIMITGHGTIDAAVRCMKAGAYDFITKPLNFERLAIEIAKAVDRNRLSLRVKDLERAGRELRYGTLIGGSEPMRRLYQTLRCVAPTDATVLVLGETGTGKELVARAVHTGSRRAAGPFVAVNAAAVPHELIESALFGHEKGAFTGALSAHPGFCEQADGGTLFLDEIGEMDFKVQAKLLRFLQDRVVQRVGGKAGRTVDVRVVAATNVDPQAQIAARKLREDLYYRLNVVTLKLPPLRDRRGDVPLLVNHFLEKSARRHGRPMSRVAPEAMCRLEAHTWPGNVRELEHVIERAVVTNIAETLTAEMLPPDVGVSAMPAEAVSAPPISAEGWSTATPMPPFATGPIAAPAPMAPAAPTAFPPPAAAAAAPAAPTPTAQAGGTGTSGVFLSPAGGTADEPASMEEMERRMIVAALEQTGGSVPAASKRLGVSEATIYRKIKHFRIQRTRRP